MIEILIHTGTKQKELVRTVAHKSSSVRCSEVVKDTIIDGTLLFLRVQEI